MKRMFYPENRRKLKAMWISLHIMGWALFLSTYIFLHYKYVVTGAILSCSAAILMVTSIILKYYYYKRIPIPHAKKVVTFLPVINNRMRLLWISLNLLGSAIILYGIFTAGHDKHYLYILGIGAAIFMVSNVFKYYAYKNGKGHDPQIVR